jgi:hypothetical protein
LFRGTGYRPVLNKLRDNIALQTEATDEEVRPQHAYQSRESFIAGHPFRIRHADFRGGGSLSGPEAGDRACPVLIQKPEFCSSMSRRPTLMLRRSRVSGTTESRFATADDHYHRDTPHAPHHGRSAVAI